MGNGPGGTGVAVFWNVENCPVPENIEPSSIQQIIEATLKKNGCSGSLTIHAYTKEALTIAGINVINFNRAKDTAEKHMIVDISKWASDICCPAACMLISEDLGFSDLVDMLKQSGCIFLLCHPNPTVSKLLGAAKHVWGWPQLLLDGKPLLVDGACTSLASDNSILNLSSHPNTCDNQDIFLSILMTLIILCYGICKWLGLMAHHEFFNFLFVMVLYIFILDDLEVINVFCSRQSVHGGARLFEIARDFHGRILVEDIKAFILTCFVGVASIYITLGQQALPSTVYLPLPMLLLLECVKCFLRLARVSVLLVIWDFEN